jgi:hypothetical protein
MSDDGSCHNPAKTSLAELPTALFSANNQITGPRQASHAARPWPARPAKAIPPAKLPGIVFLRGLPDQASRCGSESLEILESLESLLVNPDGGL